MEKLLKTIAIVLLVSSVNAYGQIDLGPKFGLQVFKPIFIFDDANEFWENDWRTGFNFGGVLTTDVGESFGLTTEIYYSRKGKKTIIKENQWENKSVYHFIEVPVLIQYKFEETTYNGIPMRWYINMGPYFSYWLGGKGKLQGGAELDYKVEFDGQSEEFAVMNISDPNRLQLGLNLGGGVIITSMKQKVVLDLRIYFAHTTLGKENSTELPVLGFSDNLEANYRLVSLSVAYLFHFDYAGTKKGKSTLKRRIKKKR